MLYHLLTFACFLWLVSVLPLYSGRVKHLPAVHAFSNPGKSPQMTASSYNLEAMSTEEL